MEALLNLMPHAHSPPRWLWWLLPALLALGAVSGALLHAGHVVGDGVDLFGTFWFYWFISDCVGHLRDPSFTDLMFHPLGKDIFAHTGDNFVDALASVPFQWIFGFPRYQPWFVAALLLGNALTFRPLARHLWGNSWAALGATLLWELNPYALFECMTGRLTQATLWFLPLAFLGFMKIEEPLDGAAPGARRRLGGAVAAGVFTGLQAWTYWFMGYFMALGFAWLALVGLIRGRTPRRAQLLGYGLAGLCCLATIAPAGLAMALQVGSGEVPGIQAAQPASIFEAPGQLANNVASQLHGYVLMETSGQPMFAYLVWGGGLLLALLLGRDRLRWVGISGLAFLFAVGTVWPREGAPDLVMPHYMLAYRYLPFFERLWFPYRLVVMAFFGATLGIGGLLARWEGGARRLFGRTLPAWLLPMGLVLTTVVEQHRHLAWPLVHRDLTPPQIYSLIGQEGGGLIEMPVGMARISIAFQPVHKQPTFGGMAENAPLFWPEGMKKRMNNSFIRFLREASRSPGEGVEFNPRDLTNLKEEGFRWVVLDRHLVDSDIHRWRWSRTASAEEIDAAPFLTQDLVSGALGAPVAVEGPLVLWDLVGGVSVPADLHPTAESLRTRSWSLEDMPDYETHLREIGRIDAPPAPRR